MGVPKGAWYAAAVRKGLVAGAPAGSGGEPGAPGGPAWWAVEFRVAWAPVNESNRGGGLRAKLGRKAAAKAASAAGLPPALPPVPAVVTLTRVGGRTPMDRDGLATAMKWVQDAVAAALGVDDGDRTRVRWVYRQRPAYGRVHVLVRVETA